MNDTIRMTRGFLQFTSTNITNIIKKFVKTHKYLIMLTPKLSKQLLKIVKSYFFTISRKSIT